ncbi:MAG: glycogen/starch/alpha-glucan phosphorylase [Flammeovirgaceae bacterium]
MTSTTNSASVIIEDDRTGLDPETLKRAFLDNLYYIQGKFPARATKIDIYKALAFTVRDRCIQRWLTSNKAYKDADARVVRYLSAEFLLGPHLGNNLLNLGLYEVMEQVMGDFGLELKEVLDQEEEPGLGNGGLGRLAACFLDSLATLNVPAVGYGIRYEFGIFNQELHNGWQVEITDRWLKYGNPWEIARTEAAVHVAFGGYTEPYYDEKGKYHVNWVPYDMVLAVPYDTPILGYNTDNAVILRLWKSEAAESFDFQTFNQGNYYGAVDDKVKAENITKVLYPNDEQISGKELRLMQQFFFVSATLQDTIRYHLEVRKYTLDTFHEKNVMQLNDTHPAIGVAELMRLLVDVHFMEWEDAWAVTQKTFAYTNHTLLPEALEKWPMPMMRRILPRHVEIILEINHHFLDEVRQQFPDDVAKLSRMSIIDESGDKYIRMANLASVGSFAINGVAALHTQLLTSHVLHDFYEMWPEKFSNKTNGVTPRRWLGLSNRRLTQLITERIGNGWLKDLRQLKQLEPFIEDKKFIKAFQACKLAAKEELATHIERKLGIVVNPNSIFDVIVKRIHEYKRQHLDILYVITLYNRIKANPDLDVVPRTFIFGGKAAPGYHTAKQIIKLINSVADIVNDDPDINGKIKVVFVPNFDVKHSQKIYPAADVSEQISMAGKEASGTGNMKFAMNGALTIGTLDGANIEIREEVGEENFFTFGLNAEEVVQLKNQGYRPYDYYQENEELRKCLDMISSGYFSRQEIGLFRGLVDKLKYDDNYLLLADYQSYVAAQDRVSEAYKDKDKWAKMALLNIANAGKFSSDRTIKQYCDEIWQIKPVHVTLPDYLPREQIDIKLNWD